MDRKAYLDHIARTAQAGPFLPTWDSLGEMTLPAWYPALRFGIFLHWGAFSVPAYRNEWYSRNMYIEGTPEFQHHIETFGPQKDFGYKDFIPRFTMEHFDPAAWAELFKASGAQYVVPVAEHHDGFQLYDTAISHWNAVEMGPHRDLLGDLTGAVRATGMIGGCSSHRAEHWFFMGQGRNFDSDVREPMALGDFYWPATKEPADHQDLFSQPTPSAEFLDDWLIRTCELVDKYHPQVLYFDWWIQHSAFKPYLQRFAAYYYNVMQAFGGGVINYKHDAFPFGCAVPDIERGQFAEAKPYLWQSDTAVARNSWCYTEQNEYKEPREILWDLCDVVSKNGRLLLNVGPRSDGTIGPDDTRILRAVGRWLERNGEAIYGTKVWRVAQEGPTAVQEGQFSDGEAKRYTAEDFRFTCRGSHVYAIAMACPEDGVLRIRSLREADASHLPLFHGIVTKVEALGYAAPLKWKRDGAFLTVDLGGIRFDEPLALRVTVA